MSDHRRDALQWAGVGLDADSDSFVDDPYHEGGWSYEEVPIYDTPIPALTERIGTRAETQPVDPRLTETELDAIEVLADGGPRHYQCLAQEADASSSTIYPLAQKLGIVQTDNGTVRLSDEVTRERVNTLLDRDRELRDGLRQNLREVADELGGLVGESDEPSALERWIDAHGAADLPPGLLFFAGGLFVLSVVVGIWYVSRR